MEQGNGIVRARVRQAGGGGGILHVHPIQREVAKSSVPAKALGDLAFTQGINRFVLSMTQHAAVG